MFTRGGKPDILVFAAVIALLAIGLIMVFSASSVMGISDYGDPYHYVQRQSILAVVGLVALFVLMRVDYHIFKSLALPGLVISFVLLVAVLFVGQGAGGATRWVRVGGFNLQPSELSKLAMINYAAVYISNKRERCAGFLGLAAAIGHSRNQIRPNYAGTGLWYRCGSSFYHGGYLCWRSAPRAAVRPFCRGTSSCVPVDDQGRIPVAAFARL